MPEVLALAASEDRIVVTRNSRHFSPLTREWAEAARAPAGCILTWSYEHDEHASILSAVEHVLATRPRQAEWHSTVVAI